MLGLYFTRCIAGKSCYVKAAWPSVKISAKARGKKKKRKEVASYWSNDGKNHVQHLLIRVFNESKRPTSILVVVVIVVVIVVVVLVVNCGVKCG